MQLLFGLLLIASSAGPAHAQNTPLVSGAVGFLHSTNAGDISFLPALEPVGVLPIGQHALIESRAFISGFTAPKNGNSGPLQTKFRASLVYLTADYILTPRLTVTAGEFLTPFNTYSERLTPLWIGNFQDAPLIYGIGNNAGSGLGGTLRGSAYSNSHMQLSYTAYFSAASAASQFPGTREIGGRFSAYFPEKRLEVGATYERVLQGQQSNPIGAYVWWQSTRVPLNIRSEYAHGPHSQGYWIEAAYRLSQWGGPSSWIGRFEPLFRMQQSFRQSPGSDGLPSASTQRADFGLDYHLPYAFRINTSYARQFSSAGNSNAWETSLIYKFTFPAWKGGSK
jgi:hypothetical protein